MERFQISKQNALQRIKAADHMLTQTYPMIRDARILLSVVNNIYQALEHCVSAVLYYDRLLRKIPPFHDNFESKFHVFRNASAMHHNLTGYIPLISAVKEIEERHKSSAVEFSKKDSFVICDENYQYKVINAESLKKLLNEAKRLYVEIEKITKSYSLAEDENAGVS